MRPTGLPKRNGASQKLAFDADLDAPAIFLRSGQHVGGDRLLLGHLDIISQSPPIGIVGWQTSIMALQSSHQIFFAFLTPLGNPIRMVFPRQLGQNNQH